MTLQLQLRTGQVDGSCWCAIVPILCNLGFVASGAGGVILPDPVTRECGYVRPFHHKESLQWPWDQVTDIMTLQLAEPTPSMFCYIIVCHIQVGSPSSRLHILWSETFCGVMSRCQPRTVGSSMPKITKACTRANPHSTTRASRYRCKLLPSLSSTWSMQSSAGPVATFNQKNSVPWGCKRCQKERSTWAHPRDWAWCQWCSHQYWYHRLRSKLLWGGQHLYSAPAWHLGKWTGPFPCWKVHMKGSGPYKTTIPAITSTGQSYVIEALYADGHTQQP